MTILSQTLEDGGLWLYTGSFTRIGELFYSWPASTINSINFMLLKVGAPTGTLSVQVRKFSDDSIIGTLGTMEAADLTTSKTWYTFNTTPVVIPSGQDIRITAEYSGGNASNYVSVRRQSSDVYAGGVYTYYQSGYFNNSFIEHTWQNLTYAPPPITSPFPCFRPA